MELRGGWGSLCALQEANWSAKAFQIKGEGADLAQGRAEEYDSIARAVRASM
jgi:hypothetical protein